MLRIRFSHLLTRMMLDLFKWMIPRLLRVCELEIQRQVGKLLLKETSTSAEFHDLKVAIMNLNTESLISKNLRYVRILI